MNYLALSGVMIAAGSVFCSAIIFLSRPANSLKLTWGLFSLAVGFWGYGLYNAYTVVQFDQALFWLRLLNLSAIAIPAFFLHFIILFTRTFLHRRWIITIIYCFVFSLAALGALFPDLFIPSLSPKCGFLFYPDPGPLYYIFMFFFLLLACLGLLVLRNYMKVASPLVLVQSKYIFWGTAIGFCGGGTTFFPVFGIPIYPFGTSLVLLYVISVTYAIARYRLMDIRLAISSVGIFIAVYTLTLGIPFYFYRIGFHLQALVLMGIFASVGPSIYLFLQRRAHEVLLAAQRRYQQTLIQASSGMGHIKDLRKLVKLIARIVMRSLKPEHCAVYVLDKSSGKYILGAALGR